jgi:hypothetical protein
MIVVATINSTLAPLIFLISRLRACSMLRDDKYSSLN